MLDFVARFGAKATKAKQAQSRLKSLDRMGWKVPVVSHWGPAGGRFTELAGPSAGVAKVRRDTPLVVTPGEPPSNARLITRLLEVGLWDDAIGELKLVERVNGPSPVTTATLAYAWNRKGELRIAINTMKRAYPQFMASGGETLPVEIRRVIFPMAYWDLIQKYAIGRGLDPHHAQNGTAYHLLQRRVSGFRPVRPCRSARQPIPCY